MERKDDFETRSAHLKALSDDQLKNRFWELAEKLTAPLVEEAKTHTSPSIERSVLLRMGFSSLEAGALVNLAGEKALISKGLGSLVLKASKSHGVSIREAGLLMIEGSYWDET